jgi:hypothetical protein
MDRYGRFLKDTAWLGRFLAFSIPSPQKMHPLEFIGLTMGFSNEF